MGECGCECESGREYVKGEKRSERRKREGRFTKRARVESFASPVESGERRFKYGSVSLFRVHDFKSSVGDTLPICQTCGCIGGCKLTHRQNSTADRLTETFHVRQPMLETGNRTHLTWLQQPCGCWWQSFQFSCYARSRRRFGAFLKRLEIRLTKFSGLPITSCGELVNALAGGLRPGPWQLDE